MSAMLRLLAWILALALVALPVVAVVNGWVGGAQFPLRTLRVQGELQRVDAARLRATVLPHARRGFFAVQPERIQAAVAALPWVERVEVRKHWPDVLEVRISEHRADCRCWTDPMRASPTWWRCTTRRANASPMPAVCAGWRWTAAAAGR